MASKPCHTLILTGDKMIKENEHRKRNTALSTTECLEWRKKVAKTNPVVVELWNMKSKNGVRSNSPI